MSETATLTQPEIDQLNWTQQVRFAQGRLSTEDARVIIANRTDTKKAKTPTLTEQCLAITQGKDQIYRG
jgi:hypothetical protein